MSLIDDMKTACVVMQRTSAPDGEGGKTTTWTGGAEIDIAFALDNSMQAQLADKQCVRSLYTLTFATDATLSFGDYIKRISDDAIFRITSRPAEKQTPSCMAVQFQSATAERTVLPA